MEGAAGLAVFDGIAAFLEVQLSEVEQAFGVQVRKRSKAVPFPLPFNGRSVSFDSEGPAMGLLARLELAQLCARRLFNIGFNPSRLARVVSSLPPRLMHTLRRLIAAVQQEALAVAQAQSLATEAIAAGTLGAGPGGAVVDLKSRCSGGEYDLWELETELGLVALEFDPATQRRTLFMCNSRAAQLWGQHREEFLARFAAHDGQLQFTDFGAVCRLASEFRAARDDAADSYLLFVFGAGPATRAMLVQACQRRYFDSLGRMSKV